MAEKKAPVTEEITRVRAQSRFVRGSARKARVVLVHIRGKSVVQARAALQFTPRAAARDILATLESAAANAEANHDLDPNTLRVEEAYADEGPTLKRWQPRARGRAMRIRKRSCHLTVVLRHDPQARGRRRGDRRAPGRCREGDDRGDAARTAHRQGRRAGGGRRADGRPRSDRGAEAEAPPREGGSRDARRRDRGDRRRRDRRRRGSGSRCSGRGRSRVEDAPSAEAASDDESTPKEEEV